MWPRCRAAMARLAWRIIQSLSASTPLALYLASTPSSLCARSASRVSIALSMVSIELLAAVARLLGSSRHGRGHALAYIADLSRTAVRARVFFAHAFHRPQHEIPGARFHRAAPAHQQGDDDAAREEDRKRYRHRPGFDQERDQSGEHGRSRYREDP